ncbi:MAG: rod shape-determining protein MreD [Acidobacteria bacterium]|nr:MAG: rod shape-determining protein MreD [Acidobacteriota bacterium]
MPVSDHRSISVFRAHPATLWIAAFAALVLQTYLPLRFPLARLADLPLLVTIYFALLNRNRLVAIALGTTLGLLQDALSHGYIGMFGMAKALVGYLAAWASIKFDPEHAVTRYALVGVFVLGHNLFMSALEQLLLSPPALQPLDLASAVLVNIALALIVFQVLDRFKRPA